MEVNAVVLCDRCRLTVSAQTTVEDGQTVILAHQCRVCATREYQSGYSEGYSACTKSRDADAAREAT